MTKNLSANQKNNFCIDYSKPMKNGAEELEKLFGFMLFFIGIGMIIGMLIAENVVLVVSAGVFLLLGYHLFCH